MMVNDVFFFRVFFVFVFSSPPPLSPCHSTTAASFFIPLLNSLNNKIISRNAAHYEAFKCLFCREIPSKNWRPENSDEFFLQKRSKGPSSSLVFFSLSLRSNQSSISSSCCLSLARACESTSSHRARPRFDSSRTHSESDRT